MSGVPGVGKSPTLRLDPQFKLCKHLDMSEAEVPLTQLQRGIRAAMRRVATGEHITITDHGHPVAVLIRYDQYLHKFNKPTNPSAGYGPDFSDGS